MFVFVFIRLNFLLWNVSLQAVLLLPCVSVSEYAKLLTSVMYRVH